MMLGVVIKQNHTKYALWKTSNVYLKESGGNEKRGWPVVGERTKKHLCESVLSV